MLPLEGRRRGRDSPLTVYRGEPTDLRKPDDGSEGLRPPLRAGRRPRLLAPFGTERCSKKGARFRRERHSVERGDEQRLVEIKEIRKTMF